MCSFQRLRADLGYVSVYGHARVEVQSVFLSVCLFFLGGVGKRLFLHKSVACVSLRGDKKIIKELEKNTVYIPFKKHIEITPVATRPQTNDFGL